MASGATWTSKRMGPLGESDPDLPQNTIVGRCLSTAMQSVLSGGPWVASPQAESREKHCAKSVLCKVTPNAKECTPPETQ